MIVAMLVIRAVMQPVEDELADDDGWLERVILEGCPFFVGMERVFFWWEGGSLLGREGNVRREEGNVRREEGNLRREEGNVRLEEGNARRENRCPPYLRWEGIWEG